MEMLGIVALLLMLKGDVVTASPIGTFATDELCHEFARERVAAAMKLGAAGIGCASRANNSIAIKVFGSVPKPLKPRK